MKKLLSVFISAAMVLSLASCGNDSSTINENEDNDEIEETTIEETETIETSVTEATLMETVPEESQLSNQDSYIVLGHYEQDGDESNGPEPIEWEVVSEQDGCVLVISRYILDCRPYHNASSPVAWETSDMRDWLNNDFFNNAFDADEQDQIVLTTLSNPGNPYAGSAGNDTEDRVFCLSVDEILEYYEFTSWIDSNQYGSSIALRAEVTPYAVSQGAYENNGRGAWWLRTPSYTGEMTCFVNDGGYAGWNYYIVYNDAADCGVRPALYLYR